MSLIALEEHYAWDPASADNVVGTWLRSNNAVAYQRLYDRGPLRLEQMDAAGIDFQILSFRRGFSGVLPDGRRHSSKGQLRERDTTLRWANP